MPIFGGLLFGTDLPVALITHNRDVLVLCAETVGGRAVDGLAISKELEEVARIRQRNVGTRHLCPSCATGPCQWSGLRCRPHGSIFSRSARVVRARQVVGPDRDARRTRRHADAGDDELALRWQARASLMTTSRCRCSLLRHRRPPRSSACPR